MARTFLVTGGTGGIGKATAELLTSHGHKVITADIANADINADLTTCLLYTSDAADDIALV